MRTSATRRLRAAIALSTLFIGMTIGDTADAEQRISAKDDPLRSAYTAGVSDPVPYGFSSWDALFAIQDRLDSVADRIVDAAGSSNSKGYASVVVSARDNSLSLYWKGALPPSIVATVAKVAPKEMRVAILPAEHSLADMQEQMISLAAQATAAGVTLVSVEPRADSSGIDVVIEGEISSARRVLTSKIPITLSAGVTAEPLASRNSDTAPYWGGARYSSVAGSCSDSFAIYLPDYPIGSPQALLTANHCRAAGSDYVRIGGSQVVNAYLAGFFPSLDTAYLQPLGAKAAPYIYRGGVDSTAVSGVKGIHGTYVGDWLCGGGAATGEHCSMQVLSVDGIYGNITHQARVSRMKYTGFGYVPDTLSVAGGRGDSGGPVFTPVTNAPRVTAKGTITLAAGSIVPCVALGTTCYSGFTFTPIGHALQSLNAALAIAP
jgi:hypothetical protein